MDSSAALFPIKSTQASPSLDVPVWDRSGEPGQREFRVDAPLQPGFSRSGGTLFRENREYFGKNPGSFRLDPAVRGAGKGRKSAPRWSRRGWEAPAGFPVGIGRLQVRPSPPAGAASPGTSPRPRGCHPMSSRPRGVVTQPGPERRKNPAGKWEKNQGSGGPGARLCHLAPSGFCFPAVLMGFNPDFLPCLSFPGPKPAQSSLREFSGNPGVDRWDLGLSAGERDPKKPQKGFSSIPAFPGPKTAQGIPGNPGGRNVGQRGFGVGYWQTRGDRARLEFAGKAPNPTDPAPKPLPGAAGTG